MNFIKKIFKGEKDELIHSQFQKFSKGEFVNRSIIEAKNSKGKYTIKTSAEFTNELVRIMANKLSNTTTKVTGAVVSTSDLTDRIEFKEKKQFQGVKRYLIEKEMSGEEIIKLLDEFPKTFFALTFDAPDGSKLKVKPKAPTSGKPGKAKEGGPKADFCTLKTNDAEWGKSFVFEKPDFQKAKIKHKYLIEKLILPEGEEDFATMREMAKRSGKIIREAVIDEQEVNSEKEFEA